MLMSQSCVHLDGHSYSMKQNVVGSCHPNSLTLHGNTKHVLCLFIKQLPSHFTSSTDTTTEQQCCHVACAVLTPAPRYATHIYPYGFSMVFLLAFYGLLVGKLVFWLVNWFI